MAASEFQNSLIKRPPFSHTFTIFILHLSFLYLVCFSAYLENMRVTRMAMEAIHSHLQPPKKNRVVLAEISNNATVSEMAKIQKSKFRAKKVKKDVEKQEVNVEKLSDPQMYVADIYDYLHNMETEAKRRPMADYIIKVQKDVSEKMRGVLVDWLVEVAGEYKLLSDTLYLTISYIDRFLSVNPLNKKGFNFLVFLQCSLLRKILIPKIIREKSGRDHYNI